MMKLVLVTYLALVSVTLIAETPRLMEGPRIDFIRTLESGEQHVALRCTKGVNADNIVKCQAQRKEGASPIVRIDVPQAAAEKLGVEFFKILPESEVTDQAVPLKKNPKGFLHYYVSYQGKNTQGSLSHDPGSRKPTSESTERAVLTLEEMLFNLFQREKLKKR